jgi:DNA-binding response OmpR family regulator
VNNGIHTKVLVIDDDQAMRDTLKIVLEPQSFDVYEARSGPEGVEATKRFKPDVVILDLLMPDMDGWQVTKAIRAFSSVPILVLSAVSKPELVTKALDEGADEYLIKPMPGSVLIAHLKRFARRARAEVVADASNQTR